MSISNNINSIKCPECGAFLDLYNIDRTHAFKCKTCGSILLWNAKEKDIEANTRIAELKFEKWKTNKKIERDIAIQKEKTKREEIKAKKEKDDEYSIWKHLFFFIILIIVLLALIYFSFSIPENKRAKDLADPSNLLAPLNSKQFLSKTGEEAKEIFLNAGFTNIQMVEINGSAGAFKKKHLVDHINFGNSSNFTTNDYINKSDPITIYYYSN